MRKIENGWYIFGDRGCTQLKIDYRMVKIVRESLLNKRVIELYLHSDEVTATSNSFWQIGRKEMNVESILSKVKSPNQAKYETREVLRKLLSCESVEELSEKITDGKEIQEIVLLGTINGLFSAMFIF